MDLDGLPSIDTYALSELEHDNTPPPPFVVDGLLPHGLTIISAPPKTGKSVFCLALADAVARGGFFLRRFQAQPGRVLYLGLEDTKWRIKTRAKKMGLRWSDDIHVAHRLPSFDQGGVALLAGYMHRNEDVKLLVIDTLARFKPKNVSENAYDHDSGYANALQEMAMDFGVAIVLVHHDTKAGHRDHLKSVSGSQGLTGAADAVWSLWRERSKNNGRLAITGRDIVEETFDMEFDVNSGGWYISSDALDRNAPKWMKHEPQKKLPRDASSQGSFDHGVVGYDA